MRFTTKPLTNQTWPDLEAIFDARGCSVARGCWCMFYRRSGAAGVPSAYGERAQQSRKDLRALAEGGAQVGLIGYRDGVPVGWVSFGPREDFAKLRRSPVLKPVDDEPVWSIVCFVVPSEHRGQGVAKALLAAAVAYCRKKRVRLLEAYPVDKAHRAHDQDMWFGAKSMFDAAGFEEVARRKPERPIVRIRPTAS
ncbi:GNAT family N-acetyltransferase [Ramlibacter solisilvae]|uniref:GCN5 family acetyltransferase n=1 Tax=Ramlibacter tataouinensis TaxID=94132 RepID=A0A127JW52_9BURK|nr:GNAT family N-acetyltransferase [Ramlibacter tataouinensis]AMO24227.1 GCN5 family acetyltransferase [Ramlibacter tataouinensis]